MDTRLLKLLKEQINKIENLKAVEQWGPEYKIWKNTTTKTVEDLFGKDYLELFKHSDTSVFSYIDDGFNQKQYLEELDKKKKLLEGFIQEKTRLEVESFVSIGKTLGLMDYDLHSLIKEVSQRRFEDGHYADAVEAAFKEVIKRVKEYIKDKTGENLDGDKAMNRAFGFEKQILLLNLINYKPTKKRTNRKE